jgi:hypothetical protein
MAVADGVKWDELSRGVRDTLAWARAAEIDASDVGTRGLLIGMLRSGEDPANALLRHFGLVDEDMFAALQRQVTDKRLDPHTPERPHLRDIPGLTANARRCLGRAAALREEGRLPDVDVGCVLTALLETPSATARAAIADLVPDVPIDTLADVTLQWLRGNDMTYPQTLASHFPRAQRETANGAPPALDPDQPWPFLAVLQRTVTSADGDVVRSVGLGLLVTRDLLVTAAGAGPDATAIATATDTRHEVRLTATADELAAFALSPQADASTVQSAPPLKAATAGGSCFIATVDDHMPNVTLQHGVVEQADGPLEERFGVELRVGLSDSRTAMGSPVISADGELIGIVGPNATNRSVTAFGSAAFGRVLAAHTLATPPAATGDPDAPPVPLLGDLSGAGNDRVADTDQLGFQPYVDAFAELIMSEHTQPPLTIGIFGSWGMGKSFLLEHIERKVLALRPETGSVEHPRVHVVHFNAWEYSATEIVWPGLVRKIVRELDEEIAWPRHKRLWTRLKWNLPRELARMGPQIAAAALVVTVAIVAAALSGEGGLAAAIGATATALGVGGVVKAAKDPVAQWITTLFCDSDYGRQLGYMEDIKQDLTSLEGRLHKDGDPDKAVTDRILILIDDLDRCEPGKAVEVLQALNLLLGFDSFIVCLGIDARIITGAVEKHYEGLLGAAGASGYEYLDKIVQIPFRIPEPTRDEILGFMAQQLGDPEESEASRARRLAAAQAQVRSSDGHGDAADSAGEAASDAPADPDTRDAADPEGSAEAADPQPSVVPATDAREPVPFTWDELQAFVQLGDYLRPNPRHLKRLVNVYRLVRALARSARTPEPLILDRPAATIRWLVMWSQWPYASNAMVEEYDELYDLHGNDLAAKEPADDPLVLLLDRVTPKLDRTTRERLDEDTGAQLRKLLGVKDGILSWDEIRRIRRFTVNFNPAVEEQVRSAPTGGSAPTGSDTA